MPVTGTRSDRFDLTHVADGAQQPARDEEPDHERRGGGGERRDDEDLRRPVELGELRADVVAGDEHGARRLARGLADRDRRREVADAPPVVDVGAEHDVAGPRLGDDPVDEAGQLLELHVGLDAGPPGRGAVDDPEGARVVVGREPLHDRADRVVARVPRLLGDDEAHRLERRVEVRVDLLEHAHPIDEVGDAARGDGRHEREQREQPDDP